MDCGWYFVISVCCSRCLFLVGHLVVEFDNCFNSFVK